MPKAIFDLLKGDYSAMMLGHGSGITTVIGILTAQGYPSGSGSGE